MWHVSLDLDAVDPTVAPGVGTPVKGGLDYREAHLIMESVADAGVMTSLEVVEVNPILDTRNTSAESRWSWCSRRSASRCCDMTPCRCFTDPAAMREEADRLRAAGLRIAVVPTMGALHGGHAELVRVAARNAAAVVVTVFVNPAQFGPNEDYTRYPRTPPPTSRSRRRRGRRSSMRPQRRRCTRRGTPPGWTSGDHGGPGRPGPPGSFPRRRDGGGQTVPRTRPHAAVFGQKDAQQVAVIRRMTRTSTSAWT